MILNGVLAYPATFNQLCHPSLSVVHEVQRKARVKEVDTLPHNLPHVRTVNRILWDCLVIF